MWMLPGTNVVQPLANLVDNIALSICTESIALYRQLEGIYYQMRGHEAAKGSCNKNDTY